MATWRTTRLLFLLLVLFGVAGMHTTGHANCVSHEAALPHGAAPSYGTALPHEAAPSHGAAAPVRDAASIRDTHPTRATPLATAVVMSGVLPAGLMVDLSEITIRDLPVAVVRPLPQLTDPSGSGHPPGWQVCVAVLSVLGLAVLVALGCVLVRRDPAASARLRTVGTGPGRHPPPRPQLGLILADLSVSRT